MAEVGRGEIDAAIARVMERIASAIEADAKTICPRDTGDLAESIEHEVQGTGGATVARIGSNLDYAASVEMGSRPHVIRPNGHPFLKFPGRDGEDVFVREVHHPGTKEQPYLRPSLFRTRDVSA